MKKILISIILIIISIYSYGQDFSEQYAGFDGTVQFLLKDSFMKLNDYFLPELNVTGIYSYVQENQIPFILVNNNKLLVLHSKDFIFMFTSDEQATVSGVAASGKLAEALLLGDEYESDTFYKESNRTYAAENLKFTRPFMPWVEGENGPGIGAQVKISWNRSDVIGIVFSNGFVSYARPELYTKNARVKKIRVEDSDDKFSFEVVLEDTPNPQNIIFPEDCNNITITVLDVYNGTDWDDTCINFILGIGKPLQTLIEK